MTFQELSEKMQLASGKVVLGRLRMESDAAKVVCDEQILEARAKRETAEAERDAKKRWIEQSREYQRPFRLAGAAITYDDVNKQWQAICGDVRASGDTPEMAADNFDHLWLYGNG